MSERRRDIPPPIYLPRITTMSDVAERPIHWLWPGRLALGRLSLLCGSPGLGKSFLSAALAATVSTGQAWPDGAACPSGSVLLMTCEDDPSDTVRPRLRVHHADLTRCHILSGSFDPEGGDPMFDRSVSLSDVDVIEQALRGIGDVRLLIVDPIGSYLGGRVDAYRDNEVRSQLAPLAALAERYGVAVLLVAHRRKAAATAADDLVMGSRAFTGVCRSVWHLSADPADADRRLLLPGKSNLARRSTGLAFRIEGEPVGVITWEPGAVEMSADDALASERDRDDGVLSAVDEAVAWLRSWLADGPRSAKETKDAAGKDGIKERTLDRAASKAKINKLPGGFGEPWQWSLPG